MASQFAWRDFGKKHKDLNSKYFPGLGKDKNLEDSLTFKFSSKAQKQFEFENKTSITNQSKTAAVLSAKVKPEALPGVELSFKASNKPSAELSVKLTDKIVPLKGAHLIFKDVAVGSKTQTFSVGGGFKNEVVNVNVNVAVPVTRKFADFLDDPIDGKNPLEDQNVQLSGDIVGRPLELPVFVGASALYTVPKENQAGYYKLVLAAAKQQDDFIAGGYLSTSLQPNSTKGEADQKVTYVGAFGYTEADDFAVSSNVNYTFDKKDAKYKGFSISAAASLKRDKDSKICAKINVIPQTILSLGYQQRLNENVDIDFGYAFLLSKGEEKTKASAFSFALNLSH